MKRAILISVLTIATLGAATTVAAREKEKPAFHDGFYAGGLIGAEWANPDWGGESSFVISDNFSANSSFNKTATPEGDDHDDADFVGSVVLGYELVDERLYLGFEIGGTFADDREFDAENSLSIAYSVPPGDSNLPFDVSGFSQTHAKASLNGSEFDIDLKPGLLIAKNFLVYARVGAAFNELEIENSATWSDKVTCDVLGPCVPPPGGIVVSTGEVSGSSSESDNVIGIRLGLGSEYLFTEHLGISLDYVFTDYGDIDTHITGNTIDSSGTSVSGTDAPTVSISTQTLMAGLMYHF